MKRIQSHHHDLLRHIATHRKLPLADLDGRLLRPLSALNLVRVHDSLVSLTVEGKAELARAQPSQVAMSRRLSAQQETLLRCIHRGGAASDEEIDRRSLNALRARGLVTENGGELFLTGAGIAALSRGPDSDQQRRGRPRHRHARSEAILRAVEELERVIPAGAEVLAGPILCAAEDLTTGFRSLAHRMQSAAKAKPN